jgi:23S rRNA (adenine2030-N6)-methyltransferase
LGALLPPKEKRGLVFIDPPFEARDEFAQLVTGLQRGHTRFRHGVFASWYPIKQLAAVREFHVGLMSSGIRDIVAVELYLRDATNPDRLNGCGLAVINPPYQFEEKARAIADAVLEGLGSGESGAGTAVIRLIDE